MILLTVNGAEIAQLTEFGALQEFEGTEGFCELEQRRRSKYNKNIAARVLTFSIKSEFDEGIDRQLQ